MHDEVAKAQLGEKITDLLCKAFMPESLMASGESNIVALIRSGVTREVTENVLRLVEDFYEAPAGDHA